MIRAMRGCCHDAAPMLDGYMLDAAAMLRVFRHVSYAWFIFAQVQAHCRRTRAQRICSRCFMRFTMPRERGADTDTARYVESAAMIKRVSSIFPPFISMTPPSRRLFAVAAPADSSCASATLYAVTFRYR